MTLPITLAIIQSLIVRVAEQRFAIPLNSVLETLLIEASDIQRSEGRELLNLRGDALLLRRLASEVRLDVPSKRRTLSSSSCWAWATSGSACSSTASKASRTR